MRIRIPRTIFLLLACLSVVAGCSIIGNDHDGIAGTYEAVVFRIEMDEEIHDILSAGGYMRVSLQKDKTVAGRYFVPASIPGAYEPGEEPEEVRFEGVYELRGDTLTFEHPQDTFVRDAKWLVKDESLYCDTFFPLQQVRVMVELRRGD